MTIRPQQQIVRAVAAGCAVLALALTVGAVAVAVRGWVLLGVAGVVAVGGLLCLGFGLVARAVELGVRASRDG
jgi:hypothetical protein